MERRHILVNKAKVRLAERQLTQGWIAHRMNLSETYISDVFRLNRLLNEERGIEFCNLLDIPYEYYYASAGIIPAWIMKRLSDDALIAALRDMGGDE